MNLKIVMIIKTTSPQLTLGSLPTYSITFSVGDKMLSLTHEFDYYPETFTEYDLQTYNERVLIINEICKSASKTTIEENHGLTMETFLFSE